MVLVAPRGAALAADLAGATHARLDSWYRTDDTAVPDVDMVDLAAKIEALDARDILVVVAEDGVTVTPFET